MKTENILFKTVYESNSNDFIYIYNKNSSIYKNGKKYYQKYKKKLQKEAREIYQNLSAEEKEKKR